MTVAVVAVVEGSVPTSQRYHIEMIVLEFWQQQAGPRGSLCELLGLCLEVVAVASC